MGSGARCQLSAVAAESGSRGLGDCRVTRPRMPVVEGMDRGWRISWFTTQVPYRCSGLPCIGVRTSPNPRGPTSARALHEHSRTARCSNSTARTWGSFARRIEWAHSMGSCPLAGRGRDLRAPASKSMAADLLAAMIAASWPHPRDRFTESSSPSQPRSCS